LTAITQQHSHLDTHQIDDRLNVDKVPAGNALSKEKYALLNQTVRSACSDKTEHGQRLLFAVVA